MPDEIIDLEALKKKLTPKRIAIGIAVIILIIAVFSSFYVVDQKEEAVILKFGKYSETTDPGLHFKLPFGIEKNFNVPTKKNLTEEFGFRTIEAGISTRYSSRDYSRESVMLTGDLNIVDVQWTIQYLITNPRQWLFNVENRIKTIRDISQSVINQLVGDRTIFDIIGNERQNVQAEGKVLMNKFFNLYEIGITIQNVKLQKTLPPRLGGVQDAFEDVNKAIQDRNRLINEGKEAYNNTIPQARGDAKRIIQEAEGYAAEKVNKAIGDIARFTAVLEKYKKNPRLTRMRIYYELFEEVFKNADNTELIDKNLKNFIPFKSLNKDKKEM